MKYLIPILILLSVNCAGAQTASTFYRNGKTQVTEWELKGNNIVIDGETLAFTRAYEGGGKVIGYVYKPVVDANGTPLKKDGKPIVNRYKILIEYYDNPIKQIKVFNGKNKMIEIFTNNDEH